MLLHPKSQHHKRHQHFYSFFEKQLPIYKEQYPNLKRQQYINMIQKEFKITQIFNKSKKKLEELKPGLFLHPHNYNFHSMGYKHLFQYESIFPLKVKQDFSYIYDCLNFICYQPKDEEDAKNAEKYTEKIKNVFSYLKEKGTLLLLIDEFHINNFFQYLTSALGNDYKTKLFINFYFIDSRAFLFLVSIQKMANSETPISIKDIKILILTTVNYIMLNYLLTLKMKIMIMLLLMI